MSTTVTQKNFWEGTGFWAGLFVLGFSLWSGFTTELGDSITGTTSQIFGTVFAIRKLVKTSSIDLIKWIKNGNTWIYLSMVLTPIFGPWVADVLPLLQELVLSITDGGNLSSIITAAVSFLVSVFYLFRDRAGAQLANALNW